MKLLLDTHVFIWWDSRPDRLSPKALQACEDEANSLLFSVVSAWEMQIKSQLGKLRLGMPLAGIVEAQRQSNSVEILPITLPHVLALEQLPRHHADPFDRLLIAQAHVEEAHLVTADSSFSAYPVSLLW